MLRTSLLIYFLWGCSWCFSQNSYHYSLVTSADSCQKGTATLHIEGTTPADSIFINWSVGITNTFHIDNLLAGNYFVQSKIIHYQDSLRRVEDNTLTFEIKKELCGVYIDNYFSPNDDGYHDLLSIVNTEYHPNFEFSVFNKWGQQVHHQKNNYKPWDGKWLGADLPDGTYYYIFFFDTSSKNNMLKGNVTIIR